MKDLETNDRTQSAPDNAAAKNKLILERKKGVTKGAITTAILSLVVLLIAGFIVVTSYNKKQDEQLAVMENQRISYTRTIMVRDSMINEWLVTFDQIEKDLGVIKQKENMISLKSTDSEVSKTRKEQVINDIRYINTLIENNKVKIASLTAQLKQSGGAMKGLQTRIASLETTLKQYETEVTDLKTTLTQKDYEIGQLNTKMAELDQTILDQTDKINGQINVLNQGFVAYGTYKELNSKGILTREKGFLGFNKKESLAQNFSDTLFDKVDVRETKTIPVNSKNARLMTTHPVNSYKMVHDFSNQISYIEIQDPEQFWKLSKYAVVEIIK